MFIFFLLIEKSQNSDIHEDEFYDNERINSLGLLQR